uniref:(California timema) hypothetical protein n=1 Tax=Timema californicum TaxID=61474 RepID=A0A7R9JF62_TIMCA|nr:unnamed protein product [Timema californicum]
MTRSKSPCSASLLDSCLSPILHVENSRDAIPESLGPLFSGEEVSWTSSLATPFTQHVSWTSLNTEEKRALLPSDGNNPRALFSPDLDNTSGCHPLDTDSDTSWKRTPVLSTELRCSGQLSNANCLTREVIKECDLTTQQEHSIVSSPVCSVKCSKIIANRISGAENKHILEHCHYEEDKSLVARRLFSKDDDINVNKIVNISIETENVDMIQQTDKSTCDVNSSDISVDLKPCNRSSTKNILGNRDSMNIDTTLNKSNISGSHMAQDIFLDLSFNTLDEIFQTTEMLATPTNQNMNQHSHLTTEKLSPLLNTDHKTFFNRTSTPLHPLTKQDGTHTVNGKTVTALSGNRNQDGKLRLEDVLKEAQILEDSDIAEMNQNSGKPSSRLNKLQAIESTQSFLPFNGLFNLANDAAPLENRSIEILSDVSTVQALQNSSGPVFENQKYSHFKRQQNKFTRQGLLSSPIAEDVSESCSRRQIHCDTTACCLKTKRHGASSRLNQVSGGEMSLSQEVFESMEALMEDEEAAGPSWAACYVSHPDVLNDRCEAPKAILCSDTGDVDPPSPTLGRFDRFSSRRHHESKRRLHFASPLQKPSSFKAEILQPLHTVTTFQNVYVSQNIISSSCDLDKITNCFQPVTGSV